MRRFVIRSAILIAAIAALLILWLWRGRDLTILLDRFRTTETSSRPIKRLSYEGNGTGGILRFEDLNLALILDVSRSDRPRVNIGTTKDDQLALSSSGKVFAFGPVRTTPENQNLAADVPLADHAKMSIRHSILAWPTPFDFNFMTGHSPTWRRFIYYDFTWEKADMARLRMIWRNEDYFYSDNRWMNTSMSYEKSSGLIRVDISSPFPSPQTSF
jgi:hypothetical protein